MTIFDGSGLWIFNMFACMGCNPPESDAARQHMLTVLQLSGARWVAPKVADGYLPYNRLVDTYHGPDETLPAFYAFMTAHGYPRLGWQYIYGNIPIQEAETAAAQIKKYNLQGFLLDPETEYDGKITAAMQFMSHLRSLCPGVPIALASWRFPSLHQAMPWQSFLDKMDSALGDVWMPQAYWEGDNSPGGAGVQLRKCVTELLALKQMPILPIGSAYGNRITAFNYWLPTSAQMDDFARTAKALGMLGISWWSWDTMVAKDAISPAQPGKYGWWASAARSSSLWSAGSLPIAPPVVLIPAPITLEGLDRRVSALEQKVGV
jgi:hypothetical protein